MFNIGFIKINRYRKNSSILTEFRFLEMSSDFYSIKLSIKRRFLHEYHTFVLFFVVVESDWIDLGFDLQSDDGEFSLIEILLKRMKQLKTLKLICRGTDGLTWRNFIEIHLTNLIDFQFKFDIRGKNIDLITYQTDWWTMIKHWFVVLHPLSTYLYTKPLIDTKFILNSSIVLSPSTDYSNIHQLIFTLNSSAFHSCRMFFPNLDHLTLIDYSNEIKPISHLQTLINFNGITHLTLDHRMTSQTFLLLLQQMKQLTSLSADDFTYSSITNKFQNETICSLIQGQIRRVSITPSKPCQTIRYVSQLCFIFAQIDHLTLNIKFTKEICIWLKKLSNLRSATIFARYGSFFNLIHHEYFHRFSLELRSSLDLRLWIR